KEFFPKLQIESKVDYVIEKRKFFHKPFVSFQALHDAIMADQDIFQLIDSRINAPIYGMSHIAPEWHKNKLNACKLYFEQIRNHYSNHQTIYTICLPKVNKYLVHATLTANNYFHKNGFKIIEVTFMYGEKYNYKP